MNIPISDEEFFDFTEEEKKEIERRVLASDKLKPKKKDILKYSIDGKDRVTIKDYIIN